MAVLTKGYCQLGKQGTRITIVGLVANVGLSVSKGVAGWMMNSASLLADATHSFSDLLSDIVTLYTFKTSRRPPDDIYPYGYGKFETLGSLAVSTLLVTGAIGIGWHSFDMLMSVVSTTTATTTSVTSSATTMVAELSAHEHRDDGVLNPNAAWFALASVVIKEWLYHATIKVARVENSNVLVANAWHHRSDALTSVVSLGAILCSYAGLPVVDPIGGLVVAGMIFKSGADIMVSSLQELMDKAVEGPEKHEILHVIAKVKADEPDLVDAYSLRCRKVGPFHHLDLILLLRPEVPLFKAHRIEQLVRTNIKKDCKNVQEVLVHLDAERQPPHH